MLREPVVLMRLFLQTPDIDSEPFSQKMFYKSAPLCKSYLEEACAQILTGADNSYGEKAMLIL
ncbi:hypothetical protein [Paenibacillus sp. GCM10012306]|uniref:hypothetical protein n=1 Tax=Paenibacillus sp. GCM10012306 TaxID=3317342 RepID=UPI0036136DC8